ncbi:MAG: TIM barrel protein [Eggerthellaceae bacterium]|nr:TIM barrel protein [Eggerthellaceae bacterium]
MTNFPVYQGCLDEHGGAAELSRECERIGIDGLEIVWGHEDYDGVLPDKDIVVGYHLTFFPSWVDFWKGREDRLLAEFGDWDTVRECYGGETRNDLIARCRKDFKRALDFQVEYVVFHVTDVLIHECYTYEFSHTDLEVCDCACELANEILEGMDTDVAFLVENQWWPGFTFCDPAMTRHLLDGIEYDNVGIMLDTGHLMSTNTNLRTQAQAARYVLERYNEHGDMREKVRGLHLHQSLSGEYVESVRGHIPEYLKGSYEERFALSYEHILSIDRHGPWTDPIVADVVREIAPEWVNNELSCWPFALRGEALVTQLRALSGL